MNKGGKAGIAAVAMLSMTGSAFAAQECIGHQDMTALKTAAVQQQLMVAALSCRATSLYNRFVLSYRDELQSSDDALKAFFQRRTGSDAEYHAFKTRLANASSLSSIGDSGSYCDEAYAAFDTALSSDRQSLDDFVSGQPARFDLSYSECNDNPRLFARNERRMDRWGRRARWSERRQPLAAEPQDNGPVAPQDHELVPDAPAY